MQQKIKDIEEKIGQLADQMKEKEFMNEFFQNSAKESQNASGVQDQ